MSEVKELPKGWEWKKLGEICDTTSGGTPNRKNNEYYGGNIPWVKSGELNRGVITDTEEKITTLGLENSSAKLFPKGTLLIALYGATIGKLAFLGIEAATNQAICGIYENDELSSKFLYNYLLYKRDSLVKQAIGGAQPNISQTILKNLDVPHSSIETQQAIVSKIEELFSEVDKGIENLRTAQQQLKTYRQSVLKWAFEGKLTEEWRKKNTKKVKGAVPKVGTEPKGDLPEGWEWVKTKDVIDIINNGYTPTSDYLSQGIGEIPFIKVYNLNFDGSLNFSKNPTFIPFEKHKKNLKRSICQPGDVLINIVGPPLGKVSIVTNQYPEWNINQAIVMFRPNDKIISKYISFFLQNSATVHWLENTSKATAGQWNVKVSTCREIPMPYTFPKEQQAIVEEIESRLSVADKMEESIATSLQQAEALKQSILKLAFEGRLVSEMKQQPKVAAKDKQDYFIQLQYLGLVAKVSKAKKIDHGEMTIAKYMYLVDRLYDVPTGFKYTRYHLGPYAIEMKKVVNNKTYFKKQKGNIEVLKEETLFKYKNQHKQQIESGVSELADIFAKYDASERAHKTELLATVCMVIEDIKSTDIKAVRASMKEWKINLTTTKLKNKAEKFSEPETKKCLAFIIEKGWDKKLI